MEIWKTDIKDKIEFDRAGYHYKRVYEDSTNRIYVYQLFTGALYSQYEVVKGKKKKQPDGTDVYIYPGDEDFGVYGYYICGTEEKCQEQIKKRITDLMELK